MFERLDRSSGKVIGFRLSGKLTDADYKEVTPQFEKAIEESGKIRVLWEMGDDFRGWDAKAAWDDFKYWREWKDDIERMVLVGDKKWEEWMSKLAKLFMRSETKYYDQSQIEEAWEWLREVD